MGRMSEDILNSFEIDQAKPPIFFQNINDLNRYKPYHPHAHDIRKAFDVMKLSGVYCVNQKPTVYFKEFKTVKDQEIRELHKQFWNLGEATLLVIITPVEITVFSGQALPAQESEDIREKKTDRIIMILDRTADILKLKSFITSVESGQIYNKFKNSFNKDKCVDHFLLENLKNVRDRLIIDKKGWTLKAVHSLLGRLIFICYLVDRKIINGVEFKKAGASSSTCLKDVFNNIEIDKVNDVLSNLSTNLQKTFNGSIFDENAPDTDKKLNQDQIEILKMFFGSEEIGKRQITFNFWAFDFSVIPIEIISSIYEDFLAAENSGDKRLSGAYYTPKHLAELVIDVALEGQKTLLNKTFLDPSCGSGVFLVILFNRIAEEWKYRNRKLNQTEHFQGLVDILNNQLCGLDISETACRIACFSLYLALLDHLEVRDIEELKKKQTPVLPDLLTLKRQNYSTPSNPVIYQGNFFDKDLPLSKSFDFVIGNPPWSTKDKKGTNEALIWLESNRNKFVNEAPITRSKRISYLIPGGQIAFAFMWKTPQHINEKGYVCLLLPTGILFNKTNKFHLGWLKLVALNRIINLSDFRNCLFKDAVAPAMIAKFEINKMVENENYHISYDTPKVSRFDPRKGVITLLPIDKKKISFHQIQKFAKDDRASLIWKTHFWGTPRHVRLIEYLLQLPNLADYSGQPNEGKMWIINAGFQPSNSASKPKPDWWKNINNYLDARRKPKFLINQSEIEEIGNRFQYLDRIRDKQTYYPPMVLVNKGFSWAAFCECPLLFQDTIYSIKGSKKDTANLIFLSAYLNSKLARYFLFHTSASYGIERDQILIRELQLLPFILPKHAENKMKSEKIISQIEARYRDLSNKISNSTLEQDNLLPEYQNFIDTMIFKYFNITNNERILIEDTINVQIKSAQPPSIYADRPIMTSISNTQAKAYITVLSNTLNEWAKRSDYVLNGSIRLYKDLEIGLVVLNKTKNKKDFEVSNITSDEFFRTLQRLKNLLPEKQGGMMVLRDLKVFDGNDLYILKPLNFRHWTKSAALNDADEIVAAILSNRR
jgi:hypothetical protein